MAYQKSRRGRNGRRRSSGSYKTQNRRTYNSKRAYGTRARRGRSQARGQTVRIVIEQPQAMTPVYSGVKMPRGARF